MIKRLPRPSAEDIQRALDAGRPREHETTPPYFVCGMWFKELSAR